MRISAIIAVCCWLVVLTACSQSFRDIESFLSEYRRLSAESTSRQGMRLETYFASPMYMAGMRSRGEEHISSHGLDSVAGIYGNALYFFVILGPDSVGESGLQADPILGSALAGGKTTFADRLNLLQNELLRSCYLELPGGEKVYPSSYSYERNWGMDSNNRFMFVFPESWNGRPIPVFKSHIVVSEFGLSFGEVRHAITKTPSLKLRV